MTAVVAWYFFFCFLFLSTKYFSFSVPGIYLGLVFCTINRTFELLKLGVAQQVYSNLRLPACLTKRCVQVPGM